MQFGMQRCSHQWRCCCCGGGGRNHRIDCTIGAVVGVVRLALDQPISSNQACVLRGCCRRGRRGAGRRRCRPDWNWRWCSLQATHGVVAGIIGLAGIAPVRGQGGWRIGYVPIGAVNDCLGGGSGRLVGVQLPTAAVATTLTMDVDSRRIFILLVQYYERIGSWVSASSRLGMHTTAANITTGRISSSAGSSTVRCCFRRSIDICRINPRRSRRRLRFQRHNAISAPAGVVCVARANSSRMNIRSVLVATRRRQEYSGRH